MKKYFLIGLISFSMLLPVTSYAQHEEDRPGSAIFVMADTTEILINQKCIDEENNQAKIHIKIPEIKGLSDKKFQKLVNHYFYKEAYTLKCDLLKKAKNGYKNKTKDEKFVPYELIYHYSEKESPNNYLTIGTFEYLYTGGAHGLTRQNYLVLDKTQNKIITLKDLFKGNNTYKKNINEEIKKQIELKKQEGKSFFEGVGAFEKISDNQVFYLNEKGDLVIVFNIYEIAPYATGILEFTLSMQALLS